MLNLLLTEESGAPAAARQALREGNGLLPNAIREDVLLLVTELVTNAVRHARAGPDRPLHVQLLRGPRWVVVAVADQGPGFTWHPAPPAGNESGGWGLWSTMCSPAQSESSPLASACRATRTSAAGSAQVP